MGTARVVRLGAESVGHVGWEEQMKRDAEKLPTESELEILTVLWQRGPSTVREVFREIAASREVGYSTVLKLMQIMTAKGSVNRDDSVRPQVYKPSRSQGQTQKNLVRNLLDRAFDGSPGNLVLQALSTKRASADERRKIRELLERLDGGAT